MSFLNPEITAIQTRIQSPNSYSGANRKTNGPTKYKELSLVKTKLFRGASASAFLTSLRPGSPTRQWLSPLLQLFILDNTFSPFENSGPKNINL